MAAARQPTTDARDIAAVKLQLLGNFAVLVAGSAVAVPPAGQRVLARLALGGGTATRSAVAGTLWPDHTQARAQANLRGAVWRMPAAVRRRLVLGPSTVALGDGWDVDVADAERLARGLPAPEPETSAERFRHDLLARLGRALAAGRARALPPATAARAGGPGRGRAGLGLPAGRGRPRAAGRDGRAAAGERPGPAAAGAPGRRQPRRGAGGLRRLPGAAGRRTGRGAERRAQRAGGGPRPRAVTRGRRARARLGA